jgi:hypothetical protein
VRPTNTTYSNGPQKGTPVSILNYVAAFPVAHDLDQESVDLVNLAAANIAVALGQVGEVHTDCTTYDAGEDMIVAKFHFAFHFDGPFVELQVVPDMRKLMLFLSPANCPVDAWDVDEIPAMSDLQYIDEDGVTDEGFYI